VKKALFAMSLLLTAFGIAALVGWGDSPSASCAETPGKAGAAPQPAGSAPSPGAKDAKPPTALKYESAIPKREMVFDQSEDEVTYTYMDRSFGLDPAEFVNTVQEQRYVAIVALRFRVANPDTPAPHRPLPDSFYHPSERLQRNPRDISADFWDIFSRGASSGLSSALMSLVPKSFSRVASNVPAERLPASDVLKVLTSQLDSSRGRVLGPDRGTPEALAPILRSVFTAERVSSERDFPESRILFSLRAETPNQAKDLVRALLVVFDYGASLAKYENYVELKQYYESKLPELQAAVKEPEQKYREAEKALERFNEAAGKEQLTKEELANLAAQQRLIAVEEAGIKARIAASEKMLKATEPFRAGGREPIANPNYDALVTLKTTAEIELVGLAAKRAAIQEILDSSKKRSELTAKRDGLGSRLADARRRVEEAERRLATYSTAVEQKMPFAEVVDGKVFIRRIKWKQPKPAAKQ